MSTDTTTLHDLAPGRDEQKAIIEATAWYLFVGAIGAAVGINTYARLVNAEVCNPGQFAALNPCTNTVVMTANRFTGIAIAVAAGAFLVGVAFLAPDIRDALAEYGGEGDA